jgi:uncharacterized membrane protein YidH (DUF202 family)
MNGTRLFATIVIAAGILAVIYGGFSYTKENTAFKLGPVELNVQEQKTVNIPLWAGIAAVVVGAIVLVGASNKSQ